MSKKKEQQKDIFYVKEEILGRHYNCGGIVKYKCSSVDSFRYCEKCGCSNDKGDVVFTRHEASLWK